MSDVNRVRIQPFLVYASALSNQFQFSEAENVYIELIELFPKSSIGFVEYGKFLYQFEKRGNDSLKMMMDSMKNQDFSPFNMNIVASLLVNNKKYLSEFLKNVMKLNTENMIKNFGFYFKMNKNIFNTTLEHKREYKTQNGIKHLLECSYFYFLCSRYSGLYLNYPFGTIMGYYYAFLIQVSLDQLILGGMLKNYCRK